MAAGLLDGGLDRSIYAGFRGKLLKGVIRQAAASGSLDGHGDPTAITAPLTPCEGFTDGYSAFTRAQAGIPSSDVRVNIFAASMPGITPAEGNQVRLDRRGAGSTWYQLRGLIEIDPANVLWNCQAFVMKAPPNVA
jgi:hypothetical protein